jgi:hypothetical protein
MSVRRQPRRARGLSALPLVGALAAWLTLASLASADFTTTRPQIIRRGPPLGAAVTSGVDWTRSNCTSMLPEPETAAVLWQQRLPGGLSGNLLVDAAGRIWGAGLGRVTQLAPDGTGEYSVPAEFSSALTTTLLNDGTRVLLAREGALWAWSARGAPRFQLNLGVGRNFSRASLLPLPSGALLASVGGWLFEIDSDGALQAHARLSEEAAATYADAGHAWIVGVAGTIWSWNGRSAPVERGGLARGVSAAARGAPGHLFAVVASRELIEWTRGASSVVALGSLQDPGPWPRIAVSPTRVSVLGLGGVISTLEGEQPLHTSGAEGAGSVPVPAHPGEVLVSSEGGVARLAPGLPLALEYAGHSRVVEGVNCAQPASLVPAGSGRIGASCKSGQIWLIGPRAMDPKPRDPKERAPATPIPDSSSMPP